MFPTEQTKPPEESTSITLVRTDSYSHLWHGTLTKYLDGRAEYTLTITRGNAEDIVKYLLHWGCEIEEKRIEGVRVQSDLGQASLVWHKE